MRIPQPKGTRGSLKWIQRLVEYAPTALDGALRSAGALSGDAKLSWRSPLPHDDYAEYRDTRFLDQIGLSGMAPELKAFWPRRGPQWDALATDGAQSAFLFEAKAHAPEMHSTCQASLTSRMVIREACNEAKAILGANPNADWLTNYYQYANRLAHLAFLRRHKVSAWLVFLYFTGDDDMSGPASEAEWRPYIRAAHQHLGLPDQIPGVASVFMATNAL